MGRPSIRALPGTSKREASRSGRTDVRDMGMGPFEDAEASPLPPMLWDVSWERIRETVAAWAYDAGRRL
jgi:hypothetical protein